MFLQRRHTATASPVKTGGRLIKRMSTMFKPSQRVVERVGTVLVEEDEEKMKVSVSSSQSSMDDIRRPSGLGPTIEEHASVMRAYRVQVPPLPPYRPPKPPPKPLHEIPPLPVEVLATILSLIPRTSVPALALLSRDFLSAAQAVLYGDLDMRDVRNPDALWIFLVTRRDLTSLTHTLRVPAWPCAQTRAYLIPRVLARMDNLRSLSLPSFDIHILRHHSAFGLRHIEFGNTRLSGQAEIELLTWLDGQTNVVSLRFPFLVDDDDVDASPHTPLPATPTRTRLLSAPTTPSQPFLFPMPPLSPLPPTPTPTQDTFTFTHTEATLLPNLATLHSPPHLIILLAPSRPLIDASITISTPIYAGFRPTTTLESLPQSVRRLNLVFNSVGKRTEEKTLRSAIVVCPAIEELEVEGEGGDECWCSIVPQFKSLRVLVMHIPGTAQVKTTKEELDERFPLPKRARTRSTSSTISHSGHSMVVSERASAARLANACPALQHVVFPNGVQWRRPSPSFPRSRSSPCLPSDDLFVKKIDRDVPPPPPRKVVPLVEQRFMKAEQCFDLNESDDDDDSLFFKPCPSRQSISMQRCHEQVEVEVQGAGKMVMTLV
ncbi:hypothetical protein ARMSODRAFT_981024 [Armillaria solidipes]|uniref:F-box domain-containing protein n=1 Tax=Armillaria solidipes TaxID=1076256 RepID=A0A2H3BG63_9AGAR|nr:hypothetical protein ARMSODRAFT_981024 [Armillaria solidipes]